MSYTRHRNRLLIAGALALAVAVACAITAVSERAARRVAPPPDPYRLLAEALAASHYETTGTPTVVRQVPSVLAHMNHEYTLRSVRTQGPRRPGPPTIDGFPDLPVTAGLGFLPAPAEDEIVTFSYDPVEGPARVIASERGPEAGLVHQIRVPVTAGPPVSVFLFAEGEPTVGIIDYQAVDARAGTAAFDYRTPRPLPIENMVRWYGSFSAAIDMLPVHAYLLSASGTGVEKAAEGHLPNLDRFSSDLPVLLASPASEPVAADMGPAAEALRRKATERSRGARVLAAAVALPAALAALAFVRSRLRRVRAKWVRELDSLGAAPAATRFFTGNPDALLDAARAESRERERQRAREEERASRLRALRVDLDRMRTRGEMTAEEVAEAEAVCADPERLALRLDAVRERLRAEAAARAEEARREREIERDIARLASDFEAVPEEHRAGEARAAWEEYKRAMAEPEATRRLGALKAARKLLPKHFRPEPF